MKAEILSIGSELMGGRIADTNAAFLSDQLTLLGFDVVRHTAVGDRREDIAGAIREIAPRSEVAIVTGGLGPTRDDPTREVFARVCGVELVEHAHARAAMLALFAARNIPAPPASNFVQCLLPQGSDYLPNPTGTAAGFAVRHGRCRFYCLPGVPSEMKVMYRQSIEPELRRLVAQAAVVRSLHTFGMGEAVIGERLFELMAEGHNPEVATQAQEGTITVRLTARDTDEAAARRRIEAAERVVRERLGEVIFGADGRSLPEAVAALLERRRLTLAVAESCTGGAVTALLTDVPGISRFLMESAVTYSNESKVRRLGVPAEVIAQHGAVSAATAEAMALGMRRTAGVDVALSVTGIAGPTGGTPEKPVGLVYIGLADAAGARVEEARTGGSRAQIKDRSAKRALNLLRLYLEGGESAHG